MADPVIRAALKLPAAAAVVAAIVDRLGRCRDSITLGITFFSNAPYRDACESGGPVQGAPEIDRSFAPSRDLNSEPMSLPREIFIEHPFDTSVITLQKLKIINSFDRSY